MRSAVLSVCVMSGLPDVDVVCVLLFVFDVVCACCLCLGDR